MPYSSWVLASGRRAGGGVGSKAGAAGAVAQAAAVKASRAALASSFRVGIFGLSTIVLASPSLTDGAIVPF